MCKPDNEFIFQNDERLLYSVTDLSFYQLESLEQSSVVFQICPSRYFDWNHLPSGSYWVYTNKVTVSGVVDKVLRVYRDKAYVEIEFAITLPHFECDYSCSHLKNPEEKLKTFNLVLQISGKDPRKTMNESASLDKIEVELYIKATTDPFFDNNTSDLYCIDTVIQLANGKIIGAT
jgi:hypothetical protein